MEVVRLSPASPSEGLRALEEVQNFATTDMGWGGETWTYRILTDDQIVPELIQKSQSCGSTEHVHYVSFQPCTSYEARSQDRLVVQNWDMPDGQWTFSGIFDGHGSHETVDFVVEHLPPRVKEALHTALVGGSASPDTIVALLYDSIVEIDSMITREFLDMFPKDRDAFAQLTDNEIESILEHDETTSNSLKTLRCLSGSTALLTLLNPSRTQLWVANLGDCRAVLISEKHDGSLVARRVTDVHNGGNALELDRVRQTHPGENECVLNSRVLGFLAPTRALGDTWMKLPACYSHRALRKRRQFDAAGLVDEHLSRVLTPPYVDNTPQVLHHHLRRSESTYDCKMKSNASEASRDADADADSGSISASVRADIALVLCSDGLVDLYEEHDADEGSYIARWAAQIGDALVLANGGRQRSVGVGVDAGASVSASVSTSISEGDRSDVPRTQQQQEQQQQNGSMNLAVHLLCDAIGGDDVRRASANLTVEMEERWMDDTTIIVERFS